MAKIARGGQRTDDGVAAWAALLRCHATLVPILARRVERETGLPLSWYDVLLELEAAEGSKLRIQQLGERVVLSRSRVSRIVDELVAEGLVRREADPDDRRASFAALTPAGRRAFRRARPVYLAAIDEHFAARLTRAEQRSIAAALTRVQDALGRR